MQMARGWREPVLTLLSGVAVALVIFRFAQHAEAGGLLADGYVYLLMADALRPDSPAVPDWRFLFGAYPFPPLYPLVLSAIGAGADALSRAILLNAVILAAVCVVATRWYRRLSIPFGPALALGCVWALLPATFLAAIDVQSEPLYTLLALTTLLLLDGQPSSRQWLLAAACCGLAVLARTAGVTLLAAFSLVWLLRGRQFGFVPLLIAWAPLAIWQAIRAHFSLTSSYLRDLPYPRGNALEAATAQISINLRALLHYAPRSFDLQGHAHVAIAVALLAGIAAFTLLKRLRRPECDALYLVGYVSLIMIWPHPDHLRRFLFVVLPILNGYAMLGLADGLRRVRVRWSTRALYALPALIALLAWPSMMVTGREIALANTPLQRALAHSPARYAAESRRAAERNAAAFAPVIEVLSRARRKLPPDACLSTAIPEQAMFYARRRSRDLVRALRSPAQLLESCPYVLMVAFRSFPDNGVPPMFPYRAFRSRLQILDVGESDVGAGRRTVRALLARYHAPSKS